MDSTIVSVRLQTNEKRLVDVSVALLAALVCYGISIVVYRLYFHPLARYTGPKLNAVSWLPGVIWTLKGRMPMETRKLHDKYGPVVRISPNELAFNTHQAFQDVYGHRNGRKDLEKHEIHVGAVDPMPGVSTISMADHDNHARQRKALSYGFSKKGLWGQESIVQSFVDKLIAKVDKYSQTGEVFDIVKWYNYLTFDVIGDLSFGESFGCLDQGEYHWWPALIFDAVKAGAIEQASRRFAAAGSPTQMWLQRLAQGSLAKRRADHLKYSRTKVMKRIENKDTDRKDFIHYIIKQSEHYDLSQDEVIVNAALFIVAGSETTASSLAALTNFLLRHPEAHQKLKDEIRTTFPTPESINLETAANLRYLNACIDEGLRVFPPAPIGFLRTQKNDDIIDGNPVPGGTAISVSSWCASHSASNFEKPDEFIPERWLEDSKLNDDKLASRPFSLGPRGCIGKDLSYLEMRLVWCHLLWRFDLVNADNAWQWDPEDNFKHMRAIAHGKSLDLMLLRRKDDCSRQVLWDSVPYRGALFSLVHFTTFRASLTTTQPPPVAMARDDARPGYASPPR